MEYPEQALSNLTLHRDQVIARLEELSQSCRSDVGSQDTGWLLGSDGKMRRGSSTVNRVREQFSRQFRGQIGLFKNADEQTQAENAFIATYVVLATENVQREHIRKAAPLWNAWFREHGTCVGLVEQIQKRIAETQEPSF